MNLLKKAAGVNQAPKYRFSVGSRVLCQIGEWAAGTVVALNYRESHWPPGKTSPYQVQCDNGSLIFVPADVDQCCRKLVPPWWAAALSEPDSFYETNPSADILRQAAAKKDVNEPDHRGHTALMEAVARGWPNAISQLIDLKADVNTATSSQTCALHLAVGHGLGIVKQLVDARADLNCQDTDPEYDAEYTSTTFETRLEHRTPLHYLCMKGDVAAAKLLLDEGAQTDLQDAQLKTPLHVAIDAEQEGTIDLLLSFGADMNLGNYESGVCNSTLMDAAFAGKTDLVKKLIAANADVNQQGKQDMSALHLAARNRRIQVSQLLLAARADMTQESKCGTPLQLARKNGGMDLLEVFGVQPLAPLNAEGVTSIAFLDAAQRAALHLE